MNPIKAVFSALIAIFILIVIYFLSQFSNSIKIAFFPVIAILGFVFFLLGLALIILTIKSKLDKKQKTFLILTGASGAGILICVILHNLVYGLLILLFGEGFWGETGDEPVFFILGLIFLPITFLVGMIGSIIMFKKK